MSDTAPRVSYDPPASEEEELGDEPFALPARRRRRFWGPWTAVLSALLIGALGFYAGVRVEKSQVAGSPVSSLSGASGSRALALSGSTGATGSGAAARAGGGGGLRALLGGGGGGSATFGTVSTIDGKSIYVTDTAGNTVKVTLSSATRITKNVGVGKSAVRPGDTVVIQGLKSSSGTIDATSLNDSGARGAGFGSRSGSAAGSGSAGSGGGSSGSASSAVNSLFGGG